MFDGGGDLTGPGRGFARPASANSGQELPRWLSPNDSGSDLPTQSTAIPSYASPTVNPHSGLHPSSYGANFHFSAAALGASSSIGSSSLGMSMSPPRWQGWGGAGSMVGSLGAMGTSFGRDRDREMEARYVRDFSCCGKQLGGLHELLEHYEEDHANLAPEVRMAAINAAQTAAGRPPPPGDRSIPQMARNAGGQPAVNSDVPTPPGMMDIEMDEPITVPTPAAFLGGQSQFASRLPTTSTSAQAANPWMAAFRTPPGPAASQGVPPSLLSFTPPPRQESPRPGSGQTMTAEQQAAKALRKAQRKAEKAASREEATGSDGEGEKRFPCPVEGCGKVYKQANGLKYHLTRSINSGHGNVGGLAIGSNDKPEGL